MSLGYRTLQLLHPDDINAAQQGYRYDNSGKDLTGPKQGDWHAEWFVVAEEDFLADPIFINVMEDVFPVYTAMHGASKWVPERIADSFEGFFAALGLIAAVSEGREHPVGLTKNPLPDGEMVRILTEIETRNPKSSLGFWVDWLKISDD